MKQVEPETKIVRPQREIVDRETALERMKSLPKRQQKLIAEVRERARQGVVK